MLVLLLNGCEQADEEYSVADLAELKVSTVASYGAHKSLPFWEKHESMFFEIGISQEGVDELALAYDEVLLKHSGIRKRIPEMIDIYEEEYTSEEISALVAFFRTEHGQTILKKESIVFQKIMKIAAEEVVDVNSDAILDDLKKVGTQVADKYLDKEVRSE